ncbi:MAG: methylmalonyl Co-A mutase-associated GTPase MeaB [Nitrososphaerales archaeon]
MRELISRQVVPEKVETSNLTNLVLKGDRKAVARAISIVENKEIGYSILLKEIYPHTGKALVIGVTGPPGTGKSTLVESLVRIYRSKGSKVAVLAVDPSSPFSGGAILGDRVRMLGHALDEKVYIRSMASRGDEGGLSKAAMNAARILDASGSDVILVETVGIGQAEVKIVGVADLVIVVLMPELGDEIQAAKAGLMEIGDIYVVNKSDLPGADKVIYNIESVISKEKQRAIKVSAKTGEGMEKLVEALSATVGSHSLLANKRRKLSEEIESKVIDELTFTMRARLASDPEFHKVVEEVLTKNQDPDGASKMLAEKYRKEG